MPHSTGTISLDQLAGRLSFSEINLVSNSKKLINDDNYSVGSLVKDTAKGIYSSVGSTNTVIGAGGLMGLGLAASPVVATVGGILAMSTLLIKSAEKIAPEFVQKHFK